MSHYIGIDIGTSTLGVAVIVNKMPVSVPLNSLEQQKTLITESQTKNNSFHFAGIKQVLGFSDSIKLYGESTVKISDLISKLIRYIKDEVESYTRQEAIGAVVAVPSVYTDKQRFVLKSILEQAGFYEVRFINEPMAALVGAPIIDDVKNLLVVNAGAGFCSFSAIKYSNSRPVAVCHEGFESMSGLNFDLQITKQIIEDLGLENVKISPEGVKYLKQIAEKVKIDLSEQEKISINIIEKKIGLAAFKDNSEIKNLQFSKEIFKKLIFPFVEQGIELSKKVVNEGFGEEPIDKIVFAGGSSRIPLIRERFLKEFGVNFIQLPDDSVARGTAVFGSSLPEPTKKTDVDSIKSSKNDEVKEPETRETKGKWSELYSDLFLTAENNWNSGNKKEAIQNISDLHRNLSKFLAGLFWSYGEEISQGGRIDEAIVIYEHAISIYSKDEMIYHSLIKAYNYKARISYEEGRIDETIGLLKKALKLSPQDTSLQNNLVNAHIAKAQKIAKAGDIDVAIRIIEDLKKNIPVSEAISGYLHELYELRVKIAFQKRNWSSARKNLKKALSYNPHCTDCLHMQKLLRSSKNKHR